MKKSAFPIWLVSALLTGVLYFLCFYALRRPFICQQSEMIKCSDLFANDLWLQALLRAAVHGLPGLGALVLMRRFPVISAAWLVLFGAWTIFITAQSYGIDGQNGCEACDVFEFLMVVTSWASLAIAILLVGLLRALSIRPRSPAQ